MGIPSQSEYLGGFQSLRTNDVNQRRGELIVEERKRRKSDRSDEKLD